MAAQNPAAIRAPGSRQDWVTSDADRVRSRLMLASLKALLDQVPGAREVLTHLAALETLLARRGVGALGSIAPKALARICGQLANLPLPADDPPLADLLGRLLDRLDHHPVPQQYLSSFLSDSKLMVSEASHSEFEAAALDNATTRPAEF